MVWVARQYRYGYRPDRQVLGYAPDIPGSHNTGDIIWGFKIIRKIGEVRMLVIYFGLFMDAIKEGTLHLMHRDLDELEKMMHCEECGSEEFIEAGERLILCNNGHPLNDHSAILKMTEDWDLVELEAGSGL